MIVSTSTGAADPRLLAACGIVSNEDDVVEKDRKVGGGPSQAKSGRQSKAEASMRCAAPDLLPPLSLPFVLVDEACQSTEPATLVPITASNSCRALVLIGDPCQLPPTVRSSPTSPLSISLMERLSSLLPAPAIKSAPSDDFDADTQFLGAKSTKQAVSLLRSMEPERHRGSYKKSFPGALLLSVQYRMHPSISAFSSALFYDGLLSTPAFLGQGRPLPEEIETVLPLPNCKVNVRFVDVNGRGNERRGNGKTRYQGGLFGPASKMETRTSYRNEAEGKRVVGLVKDILRRQATGGPSRTVGVVTPYSGQVALIKELMQADMEYQKLSESAKEEIEVKSVDGYQGRERDIVIFSAVRSNRQANVGFLTDWRRMNVALTRSKSALIVVGDLATLTEGDRHWAAFGKWCKGEQCIVKDTESA